MLAAVLNSVHPHPISLAGNWSGRWWAVGVCAVSLLIALPVIVIASFVAQPAGEVWSHLVTTVLPDYVVNSLILAFGVAFGAAVIGVATAWLTATCEFPGRRWFAWALLLPLAIPAYIIAYTYTGMLDYAGPLQTALRAFFGWQHQDYWFPEIRSLPGAIVMLSLVLYPYVYLLARAAFLEQSGSMIDTSRTLGYGPWDSFFKISLPIARPAIVAGVSLAMMETLADYGTVQYFGVATFTTGIFRTWFGLGDSVAAAQLSGVLLAFVFVLLALERWSRSRARYHHGGHRPQSRRLIRLGGGRALAALCVCAAPLLFGFALPASQLLIWSIRTAPDVVDGAFLELVVNTVLLAAVTAVFTVMLACFLGYGRRLVPGLIVRAAVRVSAFGYAVPGTVIAIGVLLPFAWFDNRLDALLQAQFGISTGLLLSGSVAALIFAYIVRFFAVSFNAVEAGLAAIRPTMDDCARSLGYTPMTVVRRIHIPMLRGSLLTALLLVFVDVMKELPATLVLRPFNFNTLAVRAYELAADERLADSSSAALAIVAAGIIPVIWLSRSMQRPDRGGK